VPGGLQKASHEYRCKEEEVWQDEIEEQTPQRSSGPWDWADDYQKMIMLIRS
jgi:hypothetical protein